MYSKSNKDLFIYFYFKAKHGHNQNLITILTKFKQKTYLNTEASHD